MPVVLGTAYASAEFSRDFSLYCKVSSTGQTVNGGGGGWGMIMLDKEVRLEKDSGCHDFWFKFKVEFTT